MDIDIWGTLQFGNGNKLKLKCGSNVYVEVGGRMLDAGGGGNSNQLQICGVTVWNAAAGPVTTSTCFPSPCVSPLPVNFTNVNAIYFNGTVRVSWTTATEINNDFFSIERSHDGMSFQFVGNVSGAGTSSIAHSYYYTDESPFLGVSYYRIRQTDFNGGYSFSPIVPVIAEELLLFPNPTEGPFSMEVMAGGLSAECVIYNALGEQVLEQFIPADPLSDKTVTEIKMPPFLLKPGVYSVHVNIGGKVLVKRLIVI